MEDLQDKQAEEKIKMLTVLSNYLFPGHEAAYHGQVLRFHQCSQNAQGQIVDGFIRCLF